MEKTYPKHAIVGGRTYTFVKAVSPAVGDEQGRIVLCRPDDTGCGQTDERYLTEKQWLDATAAFDRHAHDVGIVTSQSTAKEKIALFRLLFRGREDVHAHGFLRKDGGIGYVPACANEWVRGTCPRAANNRVKCAECSARAFKPLTDETLFAHFKGTDERLRDVVGIYVMDNNSMTQVLVMDFDKMGWQDAVRAIRKAARTQEVEAAVERSRSGNGGHVWFFFERPVDAKLARDFGNALIEQAMAAGGSLGFEAFDRMFPAQTTIPNGGFGNLIAAPFQGRARARGNSVFVDDDFVPYPDQWIYLSGVKRLDEETVRRIASARESEQADATPWEPKTHVPLSPADFSDCLRVIESDMLYVSENDLSPAATYQVKRLAAFANPEFFKLQALHRSVYGTPRVCYLGEMREGFLALPCGCKSALLSLLNKAQVNYDVQDKRYRGDPLSIAFNGMLRPEQQRAVDDLIRHDNGILSAPTGFGKTVIAAALIARVARPTLVIVPKTALVTQWAQRLAEFLEIEHPAGPTLTPSGRLSKKKQHVIGQLGGGKRRVTGIVDIATFQSLAEKDSQTGEPRAKDLVREYGMIVCDECHHAAAPQLELILKTTPARHVYGLSATPRRADGLDRALFMLCGPIRCRIDPKDQARQQSFRRVLRPCLTNIRLPELEPGASFNQVLDLLCKQEARNSLIADEVVKAVAEGSRALVLTKRKEHARLLASLVNRKLTDGNSKEIASAHILVGEGTPRQRRKKLDQALEAISDGPVAIFATESYLGEGFDASLLDTLFLATPISWDGNVTQQVGRLHREANGKDQVTIFDYVDASIPMLDRMYKKRLRTYAHLGYEVEAGNAGACTADKALFILGNQAAGSLITDIDASSRSIRLIAPYASPKACGPVASALGRAVKRGLNITCTVPKEPGDAVRAMFSAAEVPLTVDASAAHPGLAVFDKTIVWYGTLPLLAFPKKDDCSVRFSSPEAANDLLASLDETGLDPQVPGSE